MSHFVSLTQADRDFIDALRCALGLAPLYKQETTKDQLTHYLVVHGDGCRRTPTVFRERGTGPAHSQREANRLANNSRAAIRP